MKQLIITLSLIIFFMVSGCKGESKSTSDSFTAVDKENYQSGVISSIGDQPTISKIEDGIIGITYGDKEIIYYSESTNGGESFAEPEKVGTLEGLMLGYSSGPQIAFTKSSVVITAPSKTGNLYSWSKDRKEGIWRGPFRINDVEKSIEECLSSITATDEGNLYSTWIDTRIFENQSVSKEKDQTMKTNGGRPKPQGKIYVSSSVDEGKTWSKSELVYQSPDGSVCECCKPSIKSDKEGNIVIMFRNNIDGSRDLHYTKSTDKGASFSMPQKLGSGTWKINGCPMDGGGLISFGSNGLMSVWQREGMVYTATSDFSEQLIGEGRGPSISGNRDSYSIVYTNGDAVMAIHEPMTMSEMIGNGTSAKVLSTVDGILYIWVSDKGIEYKKFNRI
jgi:hypothetical protein